MAYYMYSALLSYLDEDVVLRDAGRRHVVVGLRRRVFLENEKAIRTSKRKKGMKYIYTTYIKTQERNADTT